MNTPWGKADNKKTFARGLHWVSTPSHGGFLVSRGYAEKHLSPAARAHGESFGGYLAYEEDCLANIIVLEIPETQEIFIKKVSEAEIVTAISYYHPNYLIARGIEPDPKAYAVYLARKEADARRAAKDPDLIISALGMGDDVVKVMTADESKYFVTAESYRNKNQDINLLSDCELVEGYVQTKYLYF